MSHGGSDRFRRRGQVVRSHLPFGVTWLVSPQPTTKGFSDRRPIEGPGIMKKMMMMLVIACVRTFVFYL